MTWNEYLKNYLPPSSVLLDAVFAKRWGEQEWLPNGEDRKAAARLHTQIVSRITTQRLGYLDGVETAALSSIYALFDKTRIIADELPGCRHFETLAWLLLRNGTARVSVACSMH